MVPAPAVSLFRTSACDCKTSFCRGAHLTCTSCLRRSRACNRCTSPSGEYIVPAATVNHAAPPVIRFAPAFVVSMSHPLSRFLPHQRLLSLYIILGLSGAQAPGGATSLWECSSQAVRPDSTMVGFLDGPHVDFSGNFVEITAETMEGFRNTARR